MQISLILPGYNERSSIDQTVARSREALAAHCDAYEIIIVDDASTDGMGDKADALSSLYPEVSVLHNPRNLGQGRSLLLGFSRARCPWLLHNAMDYPFDMSDLPKLIALTSEADVVVASRLSRPGYGLYRRFVSWANVLLLRSLFDLRLKDYNFVQLYRKSAVQGVEIRARSAGFVTPELLIRAHRAGRRILEVEIEYRRRERGVASAGRPGVVLRSLLDLLRFYFAPASGADARPPAKP